MNDQIKNETLAVISLDKALKYTECKSFRAQYLGAQKVLIDEALKGIEVITLQKVKGLYPRT